MFFNFLQTAHNLSNIYEKLRDLGHPLYLDQNFEDRLECSVPMPVAEKKVRISELLNLPLHKSLLSTYMLACNIASMSVIVQNLLFIIL